MHVPLTSPPIHTLWLFLLVLPASVGAQPQGEPAAPVDSFLLVSPDSIVDLRHPLLEPFVTVIVDGIGTLQAGAEYTFDPVPGRVTIRRSALKESALPDTLRGRVYYQRTPFAFKDVYTPPPLPARLFDSDQPPPAQPGPQASSELFGRGFQRSGSLTRGIQVGTNRDATVVSGFRLQLAGPVTDDVNVVASLTDEQSPIQPEGTTQSLREVDRVSIDLTGPAFGATLGDIVYERPKDRAGSFGSVSRKVQGIQGRVGTGSSSSWTSDVSMVAAGVRGTFHTVALKGLEGVQGPYRLTGKNGELFLVVIAGSERVSVNGVPLTRGETEDYTIDYATGEIFFTARRLVSSDARITVDFEYADRQYSRNIVGSTITAAQADGLLSARVSFLQEADDPDNLLAGSLSADDRSILSASGADALAAGRSGVRFVGRDSTGTRGLGQYRAVDTVIAGRTVRIIRYAPGAADAEYAATFTRVLAVPPDSAGYIRRQGGEFVFAGLGTGSHVARVLLPLPRLQRLLDATIRSEPADGMVVELDLAQSETDRNRLSDVDIPPSDQGAYHLRLSSGRRPVGLPGLSGGTFSLSLESRYVGRSFAAFGRVDPLEYDRTWDLPAGPAAERRNGVSASYAPVTGLNIDGSFSVLDRSDGVEARRAFARAGYEDGLGTSVHARTEGLERRSGPSNTSVRWDRHETGLTIPTPWGIPAIHVSAEDRRERLLDSLVAGGFRYIDAAPSLVVRPVEGLTASTGIQWRAEDSVVAGSMRHAFDAWTGTLGAVLAGSEDLHASVDVRSRRVRYTPEFAARGNLDGQTNLIRSHVRFSAVRRALQSDLFYELSSQRSARLERVFIRVASGSGQYRYAGDRNGNGVADPDEFQPVRFDGDYALLLLPGETLVPVHVVKASGRFRWRLDRTGVAGFLRSVSTETFVRVEEKSALSDASDMAFLQLSRYLRPATTLAGQQLLSQDVHVGEYDPDLSFRLRVTERRGLTQLVSGSASGYGNERSLRVRSRLGADLVQQTEAFVKRDRALGDGQMERNRDLVTTGGSADVSYTLDRTWEVGFVLGLTRIEDILAGRPNSADVNEQALRAVFGAAGKGSVRAELRREDVVVASAGAPYELTAGRAQGISWLLTLTGEAQLTQHLQISATYLGRSEGGGALVHTARVEARAVF